MRELSATQSAGRRARWRERLPLAWSPRAPWSLEDAVAKRLEELATGWRQARRTAENVGELGEDWNVKCYLFFGGLAIVRSVCGEVRAIEEHDVRECVERQQNPIDWPISPDVRRRIECSIAAVRGQRLDLQVVKVLMAALVNEKLGNLERLGWERHIDDAM